MKRLIGLGAGVFLVICGFWVGTFELFKAVGGNNQATSLYGFTSGPGPMILTALLGEFLAQRRCDVTHFLHREFGGVQVPGYL